MRVQPAFPGTAQPTGNAAASRAEATTFARLVGRGAAVAGAAGSGMPIAAPGGLLAVQQAQARVSPAPAALRRADRLLDGLARRQRALLSLADEGAAWQDMEQALAEEREPSGSAALDALLDAIELRVAVELAKEQRAPGIRDGPGPAGRAGREGRRLG